MHILFRSIHVGRFSVDFNGHVSNLEYLKWMQEAAIMHSTRFGWSPSRYVESGYSWFVGSHYIQYLGAAHEDDELGIVTWASKVKSRTLLRKYWCINKKNQNILAKAETQWVFINTSTGKPCRIIDELRKDYVEVSDEAEVKKYIEGFLGSDVHEE